jgi:hypothetical protein
MFVQACDSGDFDAVLRQKFSNANVFLALAGAAQSLSANSPPFQSGSRAMLKAALSNTSHPAERSSCFADSCSL